jgi:hypothetical protein
MQRPTHMVLQPGQVRRSSAEIDNGYFKPISNQVVPATVGRRGNGEAWVGNFCDYERPFQFGKRALCGFGSNYGHGSAAGDVASQDNIDKNQSNDQGRDGHRRESLCFVGPFRFVL